MKWLLLFALSALGCAEDASSPDTTYPSGPAVCKGGTKAPAAVVSPNFGTTQAGANAVTYFEGYAYVVESLNNTVAKIDLETGDRETWVDVGNDRNPYDIWLTSEHIYIANYISNTVTVASTATGSVITEVESSLFANPSGIARLGDRIYVSNVNYQGPGLPYGPGSIVVLDADFSPLGAIATAAKNPQYLDVVGDKLVVIDTGELSFDAGVGVPSSDAAIEIWTPRDDWSDPDVEAAVLNPQETYGAPGRPIVDPSTGLIYMGSGTAPAVFVYDPIAGKWLRGANDPIVLPGGVGNALTQTVGVVEGLLYVLTFNDDALIVLDLSCLEVLAGPLDLGTSSLIEGPIDAVVVPNKGGVLVAPIMTLSNALQRVSFSW